MKLKLAIAAALAVSAPAAPAQGPAAAAPSPPRERPLPIIAPPDPRVTFSGDNVPNGADRACLNITLERLPSSRQCAARVDRGETAAIIPVAMATAWQGRTPAAFEAAISLLERAVAAENHPAAHSVLGGYLADGPLPVERRRQGSAHLERAVVGGNPGAARVLARHLIEGRWVRQDIARGIALYERAAAAGQPQAATELALLYLHNRFVPRDEARGRRILEAAAAAGAEDASGALAILNAEARTQNFQIHPDPDPARVEVRTYPLLAPYELQPAFGFTDEFARIYYSDLSDPQTLARLERDHASLPTPYLFELARRTAFASNERAAGWLFLARMRLVYDARRCESREADQALAAWDALYQRQMGASLATMTDGGQAARRFALEREAAMPGDTRPWWLCFSGMETYAALENGPPQLRLVPEATWPALRRGVREETANAPLRPSAGNPQP